MSDAHNGFCHGVNAKEGIGFYRLFPLHIALPIATVVGDPAPTGNEHLPPRQAPVIDIGFQVRVEALKALSAKTDAVRIDLGARR